MNIATPDVPYSVAYLAQRGPGRYICPKCSGGSDGEHSLSLRFDTNQGVHWRCFRALCGFKGGPRGVATFDGPKREPRYFTRPLKPLTFEHRTLLINKFGSAELAEEVEGYSYWDDRFMLGIYGPTGYNRRGYVGYSFNQKPKALIYNEVPAEPFTHFARGVSAHQNHLVIVEDWFSAEKVALTGAVGVALMGTLLTQDALTEIAATATRSASRTWLAFDKDAYAKAIGYLQRYREQFHYGLYVWSLDRDLKYETTERIQRALDGEVNFISDAKGPGNL